LDQNAVIGSRTFVCHSRNYCTVPGELHCVMAVGIHNVVVIKVMCHGVVQLAPRDAIQKLPAGYFVKSGRSKVAALTVFRRAKLN
jgi:hypothetical protein